MTLTEIKLKHSLGELNDISLLTSEEKDRLLIDLLDEMSNDKNSSLYREGVTLGVFGLKQSVTKLGYDSDDEPIEVKPKNITLNSTKKFDGSGNFSDFTWKRHKKYFDDDVKMIVSGFIDGKLLFTLSFKYSETDFTDNIVRQLEKHLPNGDETSRYVRTAQFTYKQYKNAESLIIEYVSPNIDNYKHKFVKQFFDVITYGINK